MSRQDDQDREFTEKGLIIEARSMIAKLKHISPDNIEIELYPPLTEWSKPDVIPKVGYTIKKNGKNIETGDVSFDALRQGYLDDSNMTEFMAKQRMKDGMKDYVPIRNGYKQQLSLDKVLSWHDLKREKVAERIASMRSYGIYKVSKSDVKLLGAYTKDITKRHVENKNFMIAYEITKGENTGKSQVSLDELF